MALVGLVIVLAGLVIGIHPPGDNSFLTHLATGRIIWDAHSVPSHDPFVNLTLPAGGNIGIIQDPLGSNPKLVGATRPIPFSFPDNLVLSPDGKYLYAAYRSINDQAMGGVIMWAVVGTAYLIWAVLLFFGWLARLERTSPGGLVTSP